MAQDYPWVWNSIPIQDQYRTEEADHSFVLFVFFLASVHKNDEEWRVQLSPEQFRILRKKGTEMAGTGEYDKHVSRSTEKHLVISADVYITSSFVSWELSFLSMY